MLWWQVTFCSCKDTCQLSINWGFCSQANMALGFFLYARSAFNGFCNTCLFSVSSTVWTFRKVTILGDAILCSRGRISVGKEVGFGWVGAVACRYAVDFRSLTAWTWTMMTSLVEPFSPFWVFQRAGTKAIPFCSMCVIPCSTWWCPPTKVPRFMRNVVIFSRPKLSMDEYGRGSDWKKPDGTILEQFEVWQDNAFHTPDRANVIN